MSFRDVLFRWEGHTTVHLLRNIRMDMDVAGTRAIPACSARSDRYWVSLWEPDVLAPGELVPCRQCAVTVKRADSYFEFLTRMTTGGGS